MTLKIEQQSLITKWLGNSFRIQMIRTQRKMRNRIMQFGTAAFRTPSNNRRYDKLQMHLAQRYGQRVARSGTCKLSLDRSKSAVFAIRNPRAVHELVSKCFRRIVLVSFRCDYS